MRTAVVAAGMLVGVAACRGGPEVASYPGTDIPVFEEFRLQSAHDIEKSGQQFRQGELRYFGEGDVPELFRRFADGMAERGWTHMAADVNRERATGRFRKDDRAARLDLERQGEQVFAVIKVVQAAEPHVR